MAGRDDNRDIRGDVRGQIREFLSTRRARISPGQAGLPVYGGDRRRVPGLSRDEVAVLAGISSDIAGANQVARCGVAVGRR